MERELFKRVMGPPVMNKMTKSGDFSPVSWEKYFDLKDDICIEGTNDFFRVYSAGDMNSDLPIFVFLHGAGHTALSWGFTAVELKRSNKCKILAYDCRGHGSTVTDNESDLSAETLSQDAVNVINQICKNCSSPIIIVGHSMGGAIAARAAATQKINRLVGLVVVDVVEGTALAALSSMHSILEKRPQSFNSLEAAVEWSVSSGTLKNLDSARLSIPSQLLENEGKWVWKTNLQATEKYWKGWFTNLSQIFLSARVAKLLVLAGTDRLDTDLTIAQMQGKFQMVLLPLAGHVIQEDDPAKTAQALLQFQQRNRW